MADDPIIIGLSGVTWLLTAETGGAIQSFQRHTSRTKLEVYDAAVGKTTGLVFHNPKADYTIEIIQTGVTGLALASPGVLLSLNSTVTGNGVTTGGIYTNDVQLRHSGQDFRRFTISATQYPAIN